MGPSGVIHSEATIRQLLTRSRSPGVIYFEATRCYGPHLFHTNDAEVWRFLSRFTEWTGYRHRVVADTGLGRISIPCNARTKAHLGRELSDEEIRRLIFVEYSEKQWGVAWEAMPAAIIGRVPARRDNEDDRYFTDEFQGQPKGGVVKMFENMLEGIPLHLGAGKDDWRRQAARADLVIYTGKIDDYFNCCHGRLPYRSLRFEHFWSPQRLPHAVINQCNRLPFTRIYDHRYFSENEAPSLPAEPAQVVPEAALLPEGALPLGQAPTGMPGTILTREYPQGLIPDLCGKKSANLAFLRRLEDDCERPRTDAGPGGTLAGYFFGD